MFARVAYFLAVIAATSCDVSAAERTMPVDFIGEWCFASEDGQTISYKLPSWTEGPCKRVMTITQAGFYNDKWNCDAVRVTLTTKTAQSGTAFKAIVAARCRAEQAGSKMGTGKAESYVIERYKGSLTLRPN